MTSPHENTVQLLGTYGGDETHALSAWTSTSRELTDEKRARIPSFLKQLAEAGHTSVFEKSALHFLVTSDIATHIHLLKHRVGVSVNAESARYKELRDDKFYVPDDWSQATKSLLTQHVERSLELYHQLIEQLTKDFYQPESYNSSAGRVVLESKMLLQLARKRAKESARFVLPYATQITSDVQLNFRSFMHFVGLRADSHAQREIRWVAAMMLYHVRETQQFNHSLQAFGWTDERITAVLDELADGRAEAASNREEVE